MKPKSNLRSFLLAAGSSLLALTSAYSQTTYTWDISGAGVITGGTGAWNTSNTLWTTDAGVSNTSWVNAAGTPKNDAVFGGTAGTVTLGEAISLRNLTINTAGYIITGSTLNFTGGNINITQASTIRSAITGSPTMTDGGAGASYTYLNPTSGNMTLGAITRNVDKYLYLQGSSTSQNSIASIAYGAKNAKLYFESGTWTVGNVYGGEFYIKNTVNLIANGTLTTAYRNIYLQGGVLHYNNPAAVKGDYTNPTGTTKFLLQGGSIDQTSGAAITTSTWNPRMQWEQNWTFIGSNGAASDLYLGNGTVALTATRQVTVQNAATTLAVGGVISGTGFGLTKAGAGTLELRGASTYTGATNVTNGTLAITGTGTINTSSSLTISSGASFRYNSSTALTIGTITNNGTIAGSGNLAGITLGGSGSVDPGNSPGILTAADTDPTGGLDYNFEFTAAGLPTWSNAAASVNDVLRLTDAATPFNSALGASNTISIYLNAGALTLGQIFTGGFFTDRNVSFLSSIDTATFRYLVATGGVGTETYNGQNYDLYTGPLTFDRDTVVVSSANFAGGTITGGYVSQFTVVPEPGAAVIGSLGLLALLRRRRS